MAADICFTCLKKRLRKYLEPRLLTDEHLLEKNPNSGMIVFRRSIGISVRIYIIGIILFHGMLLLFGHAAPVDAQSITMMASWFGAILGATYFGLYSRFSSQWVYLATLYNQIKETEIQALTAGKWNDSTFMEAMADWKAAFVEDAKDLHLAKKPTYEETIREWSRNIHVRKRLERSNKFRALYRLCKECYEKELVNYDEESDCEEMEKTKNLIRTKRVPATQNEQDENFDGKSGSNKTEDVQPRN